MINKYFFELSIICPDGVWGSQLDFEKDFEKFLESKGLEGTKIHSKDRIVVEISGRTDLLSSLTEQPKQKKEPREPREPKPPPELGPQKSLANILTDLGRAKQSKKIKVFKDSIL